MQRYSGLYLLIKHNIYIANKTIYKIGKSINLHKRLYEYPKSSYLYLLILCDDINKHERELINLLKIKFILERSYGQEYFSGNINVIFVLNFTLVNLAYVITIKNFIVAIVTLM